MPAEQIQKYFTATKDYAIWPQAVNHTQWPGSGLMGDPVFDAFYSSNVQFVGNNSLQQVALQNAGAALLDKIGKPAILVGHSQGSVMPVLVADVRPELTQSIILLEPSGPPFREEVYNSPNPRPWGLTDIPLTYSPALTGPSDLLKQEHPPRGENSKGCLLQAEDPAPRQLVNLVDKPILVITGEASYHAPYDYCTAQYIRQAGCHKMEHIELGEIGIHGNGHMLFLEKNSQEIQEVLHHWIQGKAPSELRRAIGVSDIMTGMTSID